MKNLSQEKPAVKPKSLSTEEAAVYATKLSMRSPCAAVDTLLNEGRITRNLHVPESRISALLNISTATSYNWATRGVRCRETGEQLFLTKSSHRQVVFAKSRARYVDVISYKASDLISFLVASGKVKELWNLISALPSLMASKRINNSTEAFFCDQLVLDCDSSNDQEEA